MIGTRAFRLSADDLRPKAESLRAIGGRLQFAYAWFPSGEEPEVRYLSSIPGQHDFDIWVVAGRRELPSLAEVIPLISWYEREMMDLQGLTFVGHPEPYPLVLRDGGIRSNSNGFTNGRAHLPNVDAGDVQQLPFGPIRADVVESAEFTFLYVGEHIIHYQPRLFFKHRGMETCFERADVERAVVIAERVSAVGSVAH